MYYFTKKSKIKKEKNYKITDFNIDRCEVVYAGVQTSRGVKSVNLIIYDITSQTDDYKYLMISTVGQVQNHILVKKDIDIYKIINNYKKIFKKI